METVNTADHAIREGIRFIWKTLVVLGVIAGLTVAFWLEEWRGFGLVLSLACGLSGSVFLPYSRL